MNSGIKWLIAAAVIYASFTLIANSRSKEDATVYAITILMGIMVVNRTAFNREISAIAKMLRK